MLKFYTQKDLNFDNGITIVETQQNFKGYIGVTKLCGFGELTFEEKMIAKYGKAEAEKRMKQWRARGHNIHKDLEDSYYKILPKSILSKLGKHLNSEIFVHGNIFGALVLGFIDALFQDSEGRYHIVDYKTKSNKKAFDYFNNPVTMSKYYMQLLFYAILLKQMYGIEIETFNIIIVYASQEEPEMFTQNRTEIASYAGLAMDKVKKYTNT